MMKVWMSRELYGAVSRWARACSLPVTVWAVRVLAHWDGLAEAEKAACASRIEALAGSAPKDLHTCATLPDAVSERDACEVRKALAWGVLRCEERTAPLSQEVVREEWTVRRQRAELERRLARLRAEGIGGHLPMDTEFTACEVAG